jgi:membrane protein YqaA with SNARE-associated domain
MNSSGRIKALTWINVGRILALIAVIGISVFVYSIRDKAEQLAFLGYPGVFLLAFLSYATVILPAPAVAVVFAMGAVFNPLGVALVAGAGAALGEMTGYMAGFSGQGIIEQKPIYARLELWMKKYGSPTIFVISAIPNPFFDVGGAIAGSLRMPVPKFLFWCWLGETVKMIFFAFFGARFSSLIG